MTTLGTLYTLLKIYEIFMSLTLAQVKPRRFLKTRHNFFRSIWKHWSMTVRFLHSSSNEWQHQQLIPTHYSVQLYGRLHIGQFGPFGKCRVRTQGAFSALPFGKFSEYTHTHTFSQGQSNNMALIQKSSDELMHEMRNCFDKNFDKLEIYILKNIFHVPGEVCLKYGVRHLSLSLSQLSQFDKSIIKHRMRPKWVFPLGQSKPRKML